MAYACRSLHVIKPEHPPENETPLLTDIKDISNVRPPCFTHEFLSSIAYLSLNTIFTISNSLAPQYRNLSSKPRCNGDPYP